MPIYTCATCGIQRDSISSRFIEYVIGHLCEPCSNEIEALSSDSAVVRLIDSLCTSVEQLESEKRSLLASVAELQRLASTTPTEQEGE